MHRNGDIIRWYGEDRSVLTSYETTPKTKDMTAQSIYRKMGTLALLSAVCLTSCKKEKDPDAPAAPTQEQATEIMIWNERETTDGCKLYADYPTDSTQGATRNIREWINEVFGGIYADDLSDGKKMLEFYGTRYAERARKEVEEIGPGTAMDQYAYYKQTKKVYESEQFVTYTSELYLYAGGAHGSETLEGVVFRKADGRRFGWEMFTEEGKETLRGMIKEKLKTEYFKLKSDDDFYDHLLVEDARYTFPLPEAAPFFIRSGVKFVYQQYEIAPYAAGLPSCVLPYEAVDSLLTVTARPLARSHTDPLGAKPPVYRLD